MRKIVYLAVVIVVLAAALVGGSPAPAQENPDYWPTDGWRESSPDEQGMDSALVADMLAYIEEEAFNLDGLLVVRNGYIVAEQYFNGYDADEPHRLYSVSKSFTSALVGIAIGQGAITGVDQPILGFFPDRDFANPDPRKDAMTLGDFLMMASGLDWPDNNMNLTYKMASQRDWVQFVLDRPMAVEPGTEFLYHNGVSHVLSAIVQAATETDTLDFAQQFLFDPLGIRPEQYRWETDPSGIANGAWGLWMTPRDMAKFGYLYLHQGMWDGEQVVPAEWVAESTTPKISVDEETRYGYQWWIPPFSERIFSAQGLDGQFIHVLPDRNLILVITAQFRDDHDYSSPWIMLSDYLIPAIEAFSAE